MTTLRTSRVAVFDVSPDVMPAVTAALATAGIAVDECVGGAERLRAHRLSYPTALIAPGGLRSPDAVAAERGISVAQLDVLQALASGLSREETAEKLGLSVATVKTHLSPVRRALGVHSTAAAVAEAHRLGLVGGG